jgi:hypothetical protein
VQAIADISKKQAPRPQTAALQKLTIEPTTTTAHQENQQRCKYTDLA